MFANSKNRSKTVWRYVKESALGVLLVPSALLMAMAVGSDEYSWFAWFGLLPLFLTIRVLSPAVAALSGMLWGGCFYLFLSAGVVSGLSLMPHSFALLAIVLMFYAYFGVILTRWIGFNPILLGLGWILVELALTPLGLDHGLLAGTQSANSFLYRISRPLGYVFVALFVAGVNAWLVLLLSRARLRFPLPTFPLGLPNAGHCPLSETFVYIQLLSLCELYPRPPPNSC